MEPGISKTEERSLEHWDSLLKTPLSLTVRHFAKGTYTARNPKQLTALHVNRVFTVLSKEASADEHIVCSDGHILPLEPGCTYFIPSDCPVCMFLDQRLRFLSLQFSLEIFHAIDLFSGWKDVTVLKLPELLSASQNLFTSFSGPEVLLQIHSLAWHVACQLLPHCPPGYLEAFQRLAPYRKVVEYLQKYGDGSFRITNLAPLMGMTYPVFYRKFTRDIGISPKAFAQRLLCDRAKKLLELPDHNVKTVADKLGFGEASAFSRFFQKCSGHSRSAYRAQITKIGVSG